MMFRLLVLTLRLPGFPEPVDTGVVDTGVDTTGVDPGVDTGVCSTCFVVENSIVERAADTSVDIRFAGLVVALPIAFVKLLKVWVRSALLLHLLLIKGLILLLILQLLISLLLEQRKGSTVLRLHRFRLKRFE